MTVNNSETEESGGNSAHRVLVFGPSGSGTSTLGRALASALASQHFDADDFYWHPTDPPFRVKRSVAQRHKLMEQMFLPRRDWVLSGSISSWAGPITARLTCAVRMNLDPALRRERLEAREMQRLGDPEPGSVAHSEIRSFLAWADGYEAGLRPGRSLQQHVTWAATLPCPVLELDGAADVETLCEQALLAVRSGSSQVSPT